MQLESDTLSQELAELFLDTAQAIKVRLANKNIPETFSDPALARRLQNKSSDGISKVNKLRSTLLFSSDELVSKWPKADKNIIAKMYKCADKISKLSNALPFWVEKPRWYTPIIEPKPAVNRGNLTFDQNPTEWILAHLLRPALHTNLGLLPKISAADLSVGESFAQEVLSVALAKDRQYTVELPMLNLKLKNGNSATTGDISIAAIHGDGTALIKLKVRGPRLAECPEIHEAIHQLITALQLHGFDTGHDDVSLKPYPYWYTSQYDSLEGIPNQLALFSNNKGIIDSRGLQLVADTMTRLQAYNLVYPGSIPEVALHRFTLGMSRSSAVDTLLDFTISLEALLLSGSKSELTYRFCINGANYLTSNVESKVILFDQLDKLYDLRGRLVHGSNYPSQTELEEGCAQAYELSRRGLLRAVSEGFPTASVFKAMALE